MELTVEISKKNIKKSPNTIKRYLSRILAIGIAFFMVTPVFFILSFALDIDRIIWMRLWNTSIPHLMVNSLTLIFTVATGALLLGAFLAYLIERTDLPMRRILRPLLVAPLITPCYIIAICYINFFGINGLGERILQSLGITMRLPSIYGFWGAAGILILGTYPYVYTIVLTSLKKIDPRLSEAAKCLGASRFKRLSRVGVPLLIPAFGAGWILSAMYVLSDFGVVSLLRFPTFVSTIYHQMSGSYNYSVAASLSVILVVFAIILFVIQENFSTKKRFISKNNRSYDSKLTRLGMLKWPAWTFAIIVVGVSLIIPVGILMYWFMRSFTTNAQAGIWGTHLIELLHSGFNSLSVSALVATFAVFLALPIAYWSIRRPYSLTGKWVGWLSQSGIALPGVLTALGLSLVFNKIAPMLNFSVFALFSAFLVHFFAQGLQMTKAGLIQVSTELEDEARILGCSSWKTFWNITRPLLNPALVVAWILVFLSCMRELPASLLLRPAGFDPLTVRIWIAASEGFYEQSAAPALLVIFLSLPLIWILTTSKYNDQSTEITE